MHKRNYKVGDFLVATAEYFLPDAKGKAVEVLNVAADGNVEVLWLYDGDKGYYPPTDFRKYRGNCPPAARTTREPSSDYFSLMEAKDELGLD